MFKENEGTRIIKSQPNINRNLSLAQVRKDLKEIHEVVERNMEQNTIEMEEILIKLDQIENEMMELNETLVIIQVSEHTRRLIFIPCQKLY